MSQPSLKRPAPDSHTETCRLCPGKLHPCSSCRRGRAPLCAEHLRDATTPLCDRVCQLCQQYRIFWCYGCNKETINPSNKHGTCVEAHFISVHIPGYVRPAVDPNAINKDEVQESEDDDEPSENELGLFLCEMCVNNLDGSGSDTKEFFCNGCNGTKVDDCYGIVITTPGTTGLRKLTEDEEYLSEHDKPLQPGQHRVLLCRSCVAETFDNAGVHT